MTIPVLRPVSAVEMRHFASQSGLAVMFPGISQHKAWDHVSLNEAICGHWLIRRVALKQ